MLSPVPGTRWWKSANTSSWSSFIPNLYSTTLRKSSAMIRSPLRFDDTSLRKSLHAARNWYPAMPLACSRSLTLSFATSFPISHLVKSNVSFAGRVQLRGVWQFSRVNFNKLDCAFAEHEAPSMYPFSHSCVDGNRIRSRFGGSVWDNDRTGLASRAVSCMLHA